jgi:hypothetical protein
VPPSVQKNKKLAVGVSTGICGTFPHRNQLTKLFESFFERCYVINGMKTDSTTPKTARPFD